LKDFLINEAKYIPCQKCGICCKAGSCPKGKEGPNGVCKYLTNRNTCSLLEKGKVKPEDIGIGRGCVIRGNKKIFQEYKDMYGEK
jgi:hypothetical protein